MKAKSWSYAAVTKQAEDKIRSLLTSASQDNSNRSESDNKRRADLYRDWAYGVYLGWESLVSGWMDHPQDKDRMEKLALGTLEELR